MNKSAQDQPEPQKSGRSSDRAIILGPVREFLMQSVTTGAPGDKIQSEWNLSKRFGISRRVARHALQALVRDGLVVVRQGGGYFIRDNSSPNPETPKITRIGLLTFGQLSANYSYTLDAFLSGVKNAGFHPVNLNVSSASQAPAILRDNPDVDLFVLLSVSPAVQHFFAGQSKPTIVLGNTYADLGLPCIWMNELETTRQAALGLLDQTGGPLVLMQYRIPNLGLERQRLGFRFAHHERQLRLRRGQIIRIRPDGRGLKAGLAQIKRIMPRGLLVSRSSILHALIDAGLELNNPDHPIKPMLLASDVQHRFPFPISQVESNFAKSVDDAIALITRIASGQTLNQRIIPIDWKLSWQ
jgi:DNA-binding LacI/PurR family transcriptional regulator